MVGIVKYREKTKLGYRFALIVSSIDGRLIRFYKRNFSTGKWILQEKPNGSKKRIMLSKKEEKQIRKKASKSSALDDFGNLSNIGFS